MLLIECRPHWNQMGREIHMAFTGGGVQTNLKIRQFQSVDWIDIFEKPFHLLTLYNLQPCQFVTDSECLKNLKCATTY